MWFKLLLCFLVAFAYADQNPGWQHNYEYVYHVRGRLLTGLNQISNKYSGIFLKSDLTIRPTSDDNLMAKLSNSKYADIHAHLEENWEQQISENEVTYKDLHISPKPFKIMMENGVVSDIVLDRSMSNWEANIIKGVVSQLQLDTQAKNKITSSINIFTQDGFNTAVFKTMEKTVTGEAETLYEIHSLPEYELQTSPWLAPLEQNQEWIEVIKSKNFSHSKQNPSYHFGFQGAENFDAANTIGEFFSRTSVTRAVLTGNLKRFTLQSSVTVEQVTVSPNLQDQQRGLTGSIVNITLHSMRPQNENFEEVSNTVHVGVVYKYDLPFADNNEPQEKTLNSDESSSSEELNSLRRYKIRASFQGDSSESSTYPQSEVYFQAQDKPHLQEAPASPLLPFTVGYDGQAISMKQNIQEDVRMLSKKIGQEYQEPEQIPRENTVGKFLILTSLVKVMNHQQMKHVAQQLYTKEKHGPVAAAWIAYRDAVAQAGTGPAILVIEQLISNKQVSESEAAELIATTLESARQPTEKYMRFVFGMIQNEQYMAEQHLNESLLLSYTKLISDVYVNEENSHDKYPVHSFGTFNTDQGRLFVEKEVIPYLTTQLNEAVSRADTQQIHVWIRALGNIGHQQILSAFKPYLEGNRQMSQFQRVLIVMALDKLAENNPRVARSVLYKIYQNPKEYEQVRVTAVYQLMRCNPSPAMLQRMARYTNIDSNNQVNSAVKSAIESAAKLEVPRLAELRAAAQSAKPLLTAEQFGVQTSKISFTNYVVEQMQLEAKQILQTWGGDDCVLPKGLKYFLRGRFGGIKQSVVRLDAMVSSVEDLLDVGRQQTKEYRRLLKEKQAYESLKTQWSSENTAKLLNMQNKQREQLEGYIYLHLDALQKVWSFDNQTMENISEIIQEWEQQLKNGKQFNYDKMTVHPESAVSFPTAWGLPFIYTYDRPTLIHIDGEIKSESKPSLSFQGGIRTPENIDIEYKIHAFISGKSQSQFGIFVPFNHKRYSAGYDKNFQVFLPEISGKVHINLENKQVTFEVQNTDKRRDVNMLHFSTWPYTSQNNIYTVKPETESIRKENPHRFNTVLGEKLTGIAMSLKMTSDEKIDYAFLYEQLSDKNVVSGVLSSWFDNNINHMELNVGLDSSKSRTHKVIFHFGHQEKYFAGLQTKRQFLDRISHSNSLLKESWDRQNEFLQNSTKDISNVHAQVVDTIVLFEGENRIKYSATLGGSRSNIDPKGRLLIQLERNYDQEQPIKVCFSAESKVPNPPDLNLESALNFDPTSTVEIQAGIENSLGRSPQVNVNVKLSKSENRKQHMKQHPQYEQCKKQILEGNNQLPACSILTTQANLLDEFSINVDYKNIDPFTANLCYSAYSMLRHHLYPRISENVLVNEQSQKDRLTIEGKYNPDLSSLNADVSTDKIRAEIRNLPINEWSQKLFVSHPVHRVTTRVQGHAIRNPEYQAKCVIDKTAINTLDNRTYPAQLDKNWVVAFHYIPRKPSPIKNKPELTVVEQLNQQLEGYILYTRADEKDNSKKEIKLVIQSPNTLGKVIDITLKPSGSGYPRLFIQREEINYNDQGSHMYDDYMQVYKLPNNEIKAEVYDSFNVIFDGVRAKITIMNDKFRDSVRGLCGTYTGEEETDFTHPGNCIIRSPEVFVASNIVPANHRTKRMNDMLMIKAEEKKCYQKTVDYVRVISTKDSGLTRNDKYSTRNFHLKERTQYVEVGNQVCFSIEPLPVCERGSIQESVSKKVPVHCVESSSVADMMKKKIDDGLNPSFQGKTANNRVTMTVAQSCK